MKPPPIYPIGGEGGGVPDAGHIQISGLDCAILAMRS
jgi:hypothetical protein